MTKLTTHVDHNATTTNRTFKRHSFALNNLFFRKKFSKNMKKPETQFKTLEFSKKRSFKNLIKLFSKSRLLKLRLS